MPRWISLTAVVLATLGLIPFALIASSRQVSSPRPRISLVQDMGKQPKYRPQSANPMFADGRAMRLPVTGTIARGELAEDDRLNRGVDGNQWLQTIPVPVTEALLHRGQERFDIYCAACHGLSGYGNGMVAQRATELATQLGQPAVTVSSLHADAVRSRSVGEIFNTITNGVRNMPPYAAQIDVADRWAIVAYVRALQRSQSANVDDVPADKRQDLR